VKLRRFIVKHTQHSDWSIRSSIVTGWVKVNGVEIRDVLHECSSGDVIEYHDDKFTVE
jgi:16S rRNA U516 pseudouridylate synthase RsuA-like enzyme